MMANHLNHELDSLMWEITIIDEMKEHYYQPGYLFLPFDIYEPEDIVKSIDEFIPKGVHLIHEPIGKIVPGRNVVLLGNGTELSFDVLVVP